MSGAATPRPPRLARALLSRALPEDVRDGVAGDLEEVFRDRVRRSGRTRARAWYWRQALSLSTRFLAERAGEAGFGGAASALPSWIDVKLGARMLVKSPLLTITGCVAIATAIAINAGFHQFMGGMTSLVPPVPEQDRAVFIQQRDVASGDEDRRALYDAARWGRELQSVERLGIVMGAGLNLVTPDGSARRLEGAAITASAFELAGGVPQLGRPLVPSDDVPGSPAVAVVSQEVWQGDLGARPDVVGSMIRLGGEPHTVVGVAPAGFRFPVNHEVWTNLRLDPAAFAPRTGPDVVVVARLAPGRSLEQAQAELDAATARAAADNPDTHARLRAQVRPIDQMVTPVDNPSAALFILGMRIFFAMLLVVAAANVAALVFARNAARESEIAVRSALGASRGRILTQLFAEALVLALVSAGAGLAWAHFGLVYGSAVFWEVQRTAPPVWWDAGLSLPTILYALGLAVLGAGIVGVLPGLRATRRGAAATIRRSASGGGSLAFGFVPTLIIVLQVGISVAVIPLVFERVAVRLSEQAAPVSFDTSGLLTAGFDVDASVRRSLVDGEDGEALGLRFRDMRDAVRRRLEAEPGVRSVSFADRLPGLAGSAWPGTVLEVEALPDAAPGYAATARVSWEVFEAVGREVVDGRPFSRADYADAEADGVGAALVNPTFAEAFFGGRSPVGHRVRPASEDGEDGEDGEGGAGEPDAPWTEIVGVVPAGVAGPANERPQIYYPLSATAALPLGMLVQVDGDAAAFQARLRAVVAEAEPDVLLDAVYPLERVRRGELTSERFFMAILVFVALVTMLLSVTGVYSLMSFIVSRRTREIGIRTALGAGVGRILSGVFRRALLQLGAGAVLGGSVAALLLAGQDPDERALAIAVSVGGVALLLVVVGLIGCALPVARALRIQPTEALRSDA